MKTETLRAGLLASILLATPAMLLAQSTEQQRLNEAMQLQRGIYSQDATGNLDQAIEIYREVAGPRTSDRSLAAEAQYRLSQALLQKGDLPAASEALLQLSVQFPDQSARVSELVGGRTGPMAGQPPMGAMFQQQSGAAVVSPAQRAELERLMAEVAATQTAGGQTVVHDLNAMTQAEQLALGRRLMEMQAAAGLPDASYDRDFVAGGQRTVSTEVENMSWTNPQSWLRISDGATTWNLLLPAPNQLLRLGMNRESLPVGALLTVTFTVDARGAQQHDGAMVGRVESIVRSSDQVTVFDRAAMLAQQTPTQ